MRSPERLRTSPTRCDSRSAVRAGASAGCCARWTWSRGAAPCCHTNARCRTPSQDRLRLLRATHAHLSPIYGVISGPNQPLERLLDAVCAGPAAVRGRSTRRTWNTGCGPCRRRWTWRVGSPTERLLIADGHHRYTTALALPRSSGTPAIGSGPWDRILTLVVDAGDAGRARPAVPPAAGRGLTADGRAGCGGSAGTARAGRRRRPALRHRQPRRRRSHARSGRISSRANRRPSPPSTATCSTWRRRATPCGSRTTPRMRSSRSARARRWPPTSCRRPRPSGSAALVERGERLPRKSTFFWPKPRTGMVLMPLDRPRYSVSAGSSSFLMPEATTSVRLLAPAPLR